MIFNNISSLFYRQYQADTTELRKFLCTWFGEVCSCCSLSLLPQPAYNIIATMYKQIFSALYIGLHRLTQHLDMLAIRTFLYTSYSYLLDTEQVLS